MSLVGAPIMNHPALMVTQVPGMVGPGASGLTVVVSVGLVVVSGSFGLSGAGVPLSLGGFVGLSGLGVPLSFLGGVLLSPAWSSMGAAPSLAASASPSTSGPASDQTRSHSSTQAGRVAAMHSTKMVCLDGLIALQESV